MKICTVNIPESYIDAMKKLYGEGGLYPSRSELVRVAVREFLIKELKLAVNMAKYDKPEEEPFDDVNFVRIPLEKLNKDLEPVREYTTYKILRKLY